MLRSAAPGERGTPDLTEGAPDAVGGLFILCLRQRPAGSASQIPPTQLVDCSYSAYMHGSAGPVSQIPPTQLVDCSYSAYRNAGKPRLWWLDRGWNCYT